MKSILTALKTPKIPFIGSILAKMTRLEYLLARNQKFDYISAQIRSVEC